MEIFQLKKIAFAKIVYYGPALSGKTTNLQHVFADLKPEQKISKEITVVPTLKDETLSYEYHSMIDGKEQRIGGYTLNLALYTVPGQVHYAATRKIVLKGSDGVVFVADSQRTQKQVNITALAELKQHLKQWNLDGIPILLQFNKQDAGDIMTPMEMCEDLQQNGEFHFLATATKGEGVHETLNKIVQMVSDRAPI